MSLPDLEREIRQRLKDSLLHYAAKCLKIRSKMPVVIGGKSTKIIPFETNTAQKYIHSRIEKQKEEFGYIRALVLKGRQQGCSTYVGGRFYHKTTHNSGIKTFILTHRKDATSNLFKMVKRFHDNCPEIVKANTSYSNKLELVFDKLDSAYGLGTAGGGEVGRSDTIDLFHGSEVAFWKNVEDIRSGIFQAAEMAQEIILESTANGFDAMFRPMWVDAQKGYSKYIAIFVPWYWQEEYRAPVPKGFTLTEEEIEYFDLYRSNGLVDLEQMVWRRNKIIELRDIMLFKQEYPATAAEAFQVTGHDSFIKPEAVLRARKRDLGETGGLRVIGVDPARFGPDATAIADRRGRKVYSIEKYHKKGTMQIVGICKRLLDEKENPVVKMFIDVGGLGAGIIDRLHELTYTKRVVAVNFGESAIDDEKYYNRRSEMWGEMKDWFDDIRGVDVPDSDSFHMDVVTPAYGYDSTSRVKLEKKEDIKKRLGRSTDEGDSVALTFAEPVTTGGHGFKPNRQQRHIVSGGMGR